MKGHSSSFCLLHFWSTRLASGGVSVAQHFLVLPSGFFACTVLTKEDLLAQTTEECCCGALGKSWFMSGKLGAGAGWAESPWAPDALRMHRQERAALHATSMNSLSGNATSSLLEFFFLFK